MRESLGLPFQEGGKGVCCSWVLGHWQRRSAGHGRYIRDTHQPRRKSRGGGGGRDGGGWGREGGGQGEKEEDGERRRRTGREGGGRGEKEEEEEEDLTLEDLLCARHCFDHF